MKWTEHPNYKRWLYPPTIEQIEAVLKKAGVSAAHFERFNNIYPACIRKVRTGKYRMPVQFWHFFLDPEGQQKGVLNPVLKSSLNTPKRKPTNLKKNSRLAQLT